MIDNNIEIGKYLRSIRKKKGLTLVEAGKRIGISKALLSAIERGVKPLQTRHISNIIKAYNMSKEEENEFYRNVVGVEPLKEFANEITNFSKEVDFEGIKNFVSSMGKTFEGIGKFTNNFMQPLTSALNTFVNTVSVPATSIIENINKSMFPLTQILDSINALAVSATEKLAETLKPLTFLYIVDSESLPLYFFYSDKSIREMVFSSQDKKLNAQTKKSISVYLDDKIIPGLFKRWKKYERINDERWKIFKLAKRYYYNAEYHASVSLLMSQITWLIDDAYLKNKSNIDAVKDDSLEELAEFLKTDIKSVKKDPKRTFQKLGHLYIAIDNGYFIWHYASGYLLNNTLTSDESFNIKEPCRNKILHGHQTNFGTKEHALKTILAVDIAFRLYDICYQDCIDHS